MRATESTFVSNDSSPIGWLCAAARCGVVRFNRRPKVCRSTMNQQNKSTITAVPTAQERSPRGLKPLSRLSISVHFIRVLCLAAARVPYKNERLKYFRDYGTPRPARPPPHAAKRAHSAVLTSRRPPLTPVPLMSTVLRVRFVCLVYLHMLSLCLPSPLSLLPYPPPPLPSKPFFLSLFGTR